MKPKNAITRAEFLALEMSLMSEADFQARILKEAKKLGWKHYHTHNSKHSPSGWPDLVLAKGPIVIFRELKRETGRVTPAQRDWLATLTLAGFDADIWYPHDWPAIVELLTLDTRIEILIPQVQHQALARIQAREGVR